ncbi:outer membrane protein transport protein [Enterovibrio makurazakiensis]|uniref:outer membrane protein transport protein n=1 Tax=Enterovibrio makurazakiensis TaxID=2910232 RepID=UPI003D1DF2CA
MKPITQRTLLATAAALAAFQAHSAGFQISEHSASGLGRAFAGEAAIADNAAVAVRNPAAMTMFDSAQVSGGLSFIQPDVDGKVNTASGVDTSNPAFTGMSADHKDVAPDAIVPYLHYIRPIDEKMAIGFSTYSNFGLSTEYPTDSVAGSIAGQTELTTVDFNLNFAYKVAPQWSLGLGLNAVYAEAELNRQAGAALSTLNSVATYLTSPTDNVAHLKGDGWGFGWNAGALWEIDENNRLGLGYRSEVDITLEGDYRGISTALTKPQQTVAGELELNLPDIFEISGFHQLNSSWALHYSAMRIGWSSFEELKATSSDCTNWTVSPAETGECLQKDEKWEDSWRYAVGATHYLNSQWTLRTGVAYDESPVKEEYRTLSIPDSDRTWYSIGATYASSDALTIDAGIAYLSGDSVTGSEDGFTFEAGGDAYIVSIGANYNF